MGFGSYQTAWSWLHKIRKAMVRPGRRPLSERVEADETYVGGARPGRPGRGAAGKALVAGAVEAGRGKARGRRLGRLRLARLPDAGATSLEGFLAANVAKPAAVATDGWAGYADLPAQGYHHEPINFSTSWAMPFFACRPSTWSSASPSAGCSALIAVRSARSISQAYLDEYVFRFNRRTAKNISHRFARLIEQAVATKPVTYRAIVATPAPA